MKQTVEYAVTAEQHAALIAMAGDMSVQSLLDAAVQAYAAQRGKSYPTSNRRGATGKGRRKKSAYCLPPPS